MLVLKECFFSLGFCGLFFFLNLVLTEQLLAQPRRRGGQGLCDTNGVRGGVRVTADDAIYSECEKDLAPHPAPAGCNPRSWAKRQKHWEGEKAFPLGKVQPPGDLPLSSGLGWRRSRAPGCSVLELGGIVQPNLSFGVTLGPPENHGTATGSEGGCSGR